MVEKARKERDQEKCSECRRQKIKCTPPDRDWDANQQKCDRCISRRLDCGPSVRKRDDPAASPPCDKDDSNELVRSGLTQQSTTQSSHNDYVVQEDQYMASASNEGRRKKRPREDLEQHSKAFPREEIIRSIRSKFERLNAAGNAWRDASNVSPTHCGAPHMHPYEKPRTITSKFKEEFHTLYIKLYYMIEELDSRGNQDLANGLLANGLMSKLLLTEQKYPGLCDDQKRGVLMDMASFFKRNEDKYEHEYVLGKVADMVDPHIMPVDKDPCHLLATSFLEGDGEGLKPFWKKHFARSNMPSDLVVPPLQRAAQHRNPKIAGNILSRQDSINGIPAIFNLESVHIAAAMGNSATLSTLTGTDGLDINARDVHRQTPLFLAAKNGHQDCCKLLLQHNADINTRDHHGHTIVEVAAKSGSLAIVKMLVASGADIHASPPQCGSTPLQAAIESGDPSGELVQYLIGKGVDVCAQRVYDKATAMTLAHERGLHPLVRQIEEIIARGYQAPFLTY